tara:strand:+ start:1056 stop:1208 length:153 start_codon:yes stop_codon:yes gene_type:complete
MKSKDTKREFIDSKGNTWEWDETPEVTKAVERLHETIRQNKRKWDTMTGE